MKNTIFHIGVLLLVLATGCIKNNSVNNNNQGNNADTLANNVHTPSQELFPNTIGDRWRYQVTDTTIRVHQDSSSVQYFVEVAILDTVKIQNGISATLWQFRYPDHNDTNYVYFSGDTIKFMDKYGWNLVGQYIFPFTSGSFWEYVFSLPAIPQYVTVSGPADITVNNNSFSGAWRIYGYAGSPDMAFYIDDWFENHVGFVKMYYNPYGFFSNVLHNMDWSLVSYQLK